MWNSDEDEKKREAINEEVKRATSLIRGQFAPKFARELDDMEVPWEYLWSPDASYRQLEQVSRGKRKKIMLDRESKWWPWMRCTAVS